MQNGRNVTGSEKLAWKNKALPVVTDLLRKNINYPNCTGQDIMNQIGPMWEALKAQGLVTEEMTFQMFVSSAQRKYMEREMWRIMGL